MKIRLTHVLSLLLCLVMIAAAVCIGAVKGWQDERAGAVAGVLTQDGLAADLTGRALDLGSLTVVASRHLPAEDSDLAAMRSLAASLTRSVDDLSALMAGHDEVTAAVPAFAERLLALPGMKASARDRAYVRSLKDSLCTDPGLNAACERAFADFNNRMEASLIGRLAMLLGVEKLEKGASMPVDLPAAAPRCPVRTGFVTDVAGVLSTDTARDLDTLNERIETAEKIQSRMETAPLPAVHVVAVDFLDGETAAAYARALREQWGLAEGDLLLLIAAGHDEYSLTGGSSLLSRTTLDRITTEAFREPFLAQAYDSAVATLMPRLMEAVNDTWRVDVAVGDLFGSRMTGSIPDWAAGIFGSERPADTAGVTIRGAGSRLIPLLSVILIVGALLLFFGSFTGRRSPRRAARRPPRHGGGRPGRSPAPRGRHRR